MQAYRDKMGDERIRHDKAMENIDRIRANIAKTSKVTDADAKALKENAIEAQASYKNVEDLYNKHLSSIKNNSAYKWPETLVGEEKTKYDEEISNLEEEKTIVDAMEKNANSAHTIASQYNVVTLKTDTGKKLTAEPQTVKSIADAKALPKNTKFWYNEQLFITHGNGTVDKVSE